MSIDSLHFHDFLLIHYFLLVLYPHKLIEYFWNWFKIRWVSGPINGLVGQLVARRPQVGFTRCLPMGIVLMGTDKWFDRSACGPLAANCPPLTFTDLLMGLIALIG